MTNHSIPIVAPEYTSPVILEILRRREERDEEKARLAAMTDFERGELHGQAVFESCCRRNGFGDSAGVLVAILYELLRSNDPNIQGAYTLTMRHATLEFTDAAPEQLLRFIEAEVPGLQIPRIQAVL